MGMESVIKYLSPITHKISTSASKLLDSFFMSANLQTQGMIYYTALECRVEQTEQVKEV